MIYKIKYVASVTIVVIGIIGAVYGLLRSPKPTCEENLSTALAETIKVNMQHAEIILTLEKKILQIKNNSRVTISTLEENIITQETMHVEELKAAYKNGRLKGMIHERENCNNFDLYTI